MNDRYLYRAKRNNWRELPEEKWWVTGYLVNKKCWKCNTVGFEEFEEMVIVTQFSDGGIDWCYIEKDTICRCTGLEDKNEKLIFENDIVSGKMYLDHGQWGESVDDKRLVEWDDDYARFSPCSHMKLDKYEVIGNIFDNPELLEVGE